MPLSSHQSWRADLVVEPVHGGYVWLDAYKFGYERKKKYIRPKHDVLLVLPPIDTPKAEPATAQARLTPPLKTLRYSELSQAARSYISKLQTQPLGGSDNHLRRRYASCVTPNLNFSAMAVDRGSLQTRFVRKPSGRR